MKRIFCILTTICCIFSLFGLVACDNQEISPGNGHIHNWINSWRMNDTYHWKDCDSCLEENNKSKHTFYENVCSLCGYTKNDSNNGGASNNNSETSYLTIITDKTAIKQKNSNNKISLAVKNDRDIFNFNNLFSYSNHYNFEIYALTFSSIDYISKEATLSNGYNHFQIKFKHLINLTETYYDVEIFKDPGDLISTPSKYNLKHNYSYEYFTDGRPVLNVSFSYEDAFINNVSINGYDCKAKLKDFNLKFQVTYEFGVSTDNWYSPNGAPMRSKTIVKEYVLTNPTDTISDTIEFLNDEFYQENYLGNIIHNPRMTLTYNVNYFFSTNYMVRNIDYSQMDMFK